MLESVLRMLILGHLIYGIYLFYVIIGEQDDRE